MHLEFLRNRDGAQTCSGLQLVRYTGDARLDEIMRIYREHGVFINNPHVFIVEDGKQGQLTPGWSRARSASIRWAAESRKVAQPGRASQPDDRAGRAPDGRWSTRSGVDVQRVAQGACPGARRGRICCDGASSAAFILALIESTLARYSAIFSLPYGVFAETQWVQSESLTSERARSASSVRALVAEPPASAPALEVPPSCGDHVGLSAGAPVLERRGMELRTCSRAAATLRSMVGSAAARSED